MSEKGNPKRQRTTKKPDYLDDFALDEVFTDVDYLTWEEQEEEAQSSDSK